MSNAMRTDPRYPYTYASDYLRDITGKTTNGDAKLSRSDASKIREGVALALGMDDAELARRLADYYKTYDFGYDFEMP